MSSFKFICSATFLRKVRASQSSMSFKLSGLCVTSNFSFITGFLTSFTVSFLNSFFFSFIVSSFLTGSAFFLGSTLTFASFEPIPKNPLEGSSSTVTSTSSIVSFRSAKASFTASSISVPHFSEKSILIFPPVK